MKVITGQQNNTYICDLSQMYVFFPSYYVLELYIYLYMTNKSLKIHSQ